MRVGIGYDVHQLVEKRKLILGGVSVPFDKGLSGHSDADVLTHAIMDALLGAAGLGDIGQQFPDNDDRYKGISSMVLLRRVGQILEENHYRVGNIDAVIVIQKPKISPYIHAMKENIADALGISLCQAGIKATTTEGLGFTGTGRGIAAQAVALLYSSDE
jgi:2-C-methyl-D-erythritol 2,4-cyclodiphosphate synthase